MGCNRFKEFKDSDNNNAIKKVLFTCSRNAIGQLFSTASTGPNLAADMLEFDLKINGVEDNAKAFFDTFYEHYTKHISETAVRLIEKKTTKKIDELEKALDQAKENIAYWTRPENWECNLIMKED